LAQAGASRNARSPHPKPTVRMKFAMAGMLWYEPGGDRTFLGRTRQGCLVAVGLGALDAGLRLLPIGLVPLVLAPRAGALADWFGERTLIVTGTATMGVGLVWMASVATRRCRTGGRPGDDACGCQPGRGRGPGEGVRHGQHTGHGAQNRSGTYRIDSLGGRS
jgi:hypothetical protein